MTEFHPIANLFPMMGEQEYQELKEDIRKNGQVSPAVLHPDGRILDGRNRYKACQELCIQCSVTTWDHKELTPLQYVISKNLHRRHLTSSQRAIIAQEVLPMLEEEARERMRWTPTSNQKIDYSDVGQASDKAAEIFGTNRQYVSDAKKLIEEAPDLAEEVKAGEKTITHAKRELVARQRPSVEAPITETKYRIIYADPPWSYRQHGASVDENYGGARRHYPDMTIEELCNLPVKDLAAQDAALFIWVTSPKLNQVWDIIDAWGFDYKTSFVWDKIKHNFGYYNSVRHEFLLICGRGKSTPDVKELFDSVQSIERSDNHSEKPEEFRNIIDTLYPTGKRIELFARTKAEGWDTWGNE